MSTLHASCVALLTYFTVWNRYHALDANMVRNIVVCGQHGGLGAYEQSPFAMTWGPRRTRTRRAGPSTSSKMPPRPRKRLVHFEPILFNFVSETQK